MNRPARRRTDPDEVRARILEVAEEHFRRIGHHKTSMADIATALGMSAANVYRFFYSRDAINEAICRRVVNEVTDIGFAIARSDAPALDKIDRLLTAVHRHTNLPGGQILGPTFDYTHRLLEPETAAAAAPAEVRRGEADAGAAVPHVTSLLDHEGLIEPNALPEQNSPVGDLTRSALSFPADRDLRLQALARGDEGFLLALGYSTQRGYGRTHPFAGEIRMGEVEVLFMPEELGFEVTLGTIVVTECEMVNQFKGSADKAPQFTRGYGLAFGHSERKAMSMALVDRSLRARELSEEIVAPAQDEEFVLSHCDNVQATGFVEHLKLPHYVDFQAELVLLRQLRQEWAQGRQSAEGSGSEAAE